ncbi:hypothetical protein EV702DRAFT_1041235 [Suillus placidus]|uniref:Uncharacterized protein n=1 Tax=Suillus placidus TaxID=48579 RepID=A0A9P7A4M7_9AGAM|nr:hypothetical protein EV702DRAFT_1041235 [Suillus placidus]
MVYRAARAATIEFAVEGTFTVKLKAAITVRTKERHIICDTRIPEAQLRGLMDAERNPESYYPWGNTKLDTGGSAAETSECVPQATFIVKQRSPRCARQYNVVKVFVQLMVARDTSPPVGHFAVQYEYVKKVFEHQSLRLDNRPVAPSYIPLLPSRPSSTTQIITAFRRSFHREFSTHTGTIYHRISAIALSYTAPIIDFPLAGVPTILDSMIVNMEGLPAFLRLQWLREHHWASADHKSLDQVHLELWMDAIHGWVASNVKKVQQTQLVSSMLALEVFQTVNHSLTCIEFDLTNKTRRCATCIRGGYAYVAMGERERYNFFLSAYPTRWDYGTIPSQERKRKDAGLHTSVSVRVEA